MRVPSDHAADSPSRRTLLKRLSLAGVFLGVSRTQARDTPVLQFAAASPAIKQYKQLGSTDIKLADISFGGSRLRGDVQVVEHAFERGINYFDTAESYTGGRSEETIGKALRGNKMYYEDYRAESMATERYATLEQNAAGCLTCTHQSCATAYPYDLPIPDLTRQAHRLLRKVP